MERLGGWCWYLTDKAGLLERHRCGKWMYFFKDQAFAMSICEKAITENVDWTSIAGISYLKEGKVLFFKIREEKKQTD